jgi:hypothetical protein
MYEGFISAFSEWGMTRGTSEIELALAKPIGVSKKFHLRDNYSVSRVRAFDYLGDDSSSDVRKTPSPERATEKCVSPPPLASGEFLCFSFTIFTMGPDNFFCRSYPTSSLARFAAGEPR